MALIKKGGRNDLPKNKEDKEWGGNKKSTFVQLGASNHSEKDRELNDFYATEPSALEIFLNKLQQDGIELHENIWECACGMGHLSEVLKNHGYNVISTDIVNRGYGDYFFDFLTTKGKNKKWDILTNPPFKYAEQFIKHSLDIQEDGYYTIMFLKIQFLEGQKRKEMFEEAPPKFVYVNSARQLCAMNGEFEKYNATALCYCWFVWQKGYTGETIVRWI